MIADGWPLNPLLYMLAMIRLGGNFHLWQLARLLILHPPGSRFALLVE